LGLVAAFLVFRTLDRATGSSGQGSGNVAPSLIVAGVVALVLVGRGFIAWWTTEYRVEAGELRVDSGLLQRRAKRVRLDRLQSVDVLKPLAARIFGLAELRVTTAGTERSAVRLRYLSLPVAQALRAELLGRSAGLGEGVAESPERPLVVVPHATLVASVLLQLLSWRLIFILVGPVIIIVASTSGGGHHPAATGVAVAVLVSVLLVLAHTIWRRTTTLWSFTVAESPDGLRIRHGLLSTSHQTVPLGRIQAVRVHQPTFWRPFDWAMVQINVAGYAGGRESHNTMLLPVAPRPFADWLMGRVLGGVDLGTVDWSTPPARAAFRAPLWWRRQGVGADQRVFYARHGMLSRTVEAVPHERTQSVRLKAGPWERALGLASLHLDSTRGPVRVAARFRDASEARAMLDAQADRARQARRQAADAHSARPAVSP